MLEPRILVPRRRTTAPAPERRETDPLAAFHREIDRLFEGFFGGELDAGEELAAWRPRIDVREGDDEIVVVADLPGVSADAVDLSVRDDLLTLEGRREDTREDDPAGWHRRERVTGGFSRTIRMPFEIDADRVDAKSRDGVLYVHVPKPAENERGGARRIPIAKDEGR